MEGSRQLGLECGGEEQVEAWSGVGHQEEWSWTLLVEKTIPGECLQCESVRQGQSLGTPSVPGQEEDEAGRAGGGAEGETCCGPGGRELEGRN